MDIQRRLQICHLLAIMEANPESSKKLGLRNTSHYTAGKNLRSSQTLQLNHTQPAGQRPDWPV